MLKKKKKIIYRTRADRDNRSSGFHYILFNKPFGVLSQFTTTTDEHETLSSYGPFPEEVYPVGRLDADSEGLLLLTNDGSLKHLLIDPKFRHPRTYLAQVEHIPHQNALQRFCSGLIIEGTKTLPSEARILPVEPSLPPRPVPIRFRMSVPTAWMEIILYEGKNRQVRKMTAAIGHPTLRLVRVGIGPLKLGNLAPGEKRDLTVREVNTLRRAVLQNIHKS